MEPVTHLLTGACIGRSGLNRTSAYTTLIVTLAAEFPDADVLWSIKGPVEGFAAHRGFTHSFIGAPLDAAIVLGFVYAFHRWQLKRGKAPTMAPRWGLLFLFGILAVLSHILLDFTNNYGVRPWLPFSWRWYSWDIVFIVEPLMLLALAMGLLLPSIFGLVGGEIGARKEKFRGRWSAVVALVIVCLIWWMRDYQHRQAVTLLGSADYRGEVVKRAAAMPYALNPFTWAGIVETEDFYAEIPINTLSSDVDALEHTQIFYKPSDTRVTLAAKRSRLGQVYLDWARFPLVEAEALAGAGGYLVNFRDLRFDYFRVTLPGQQRARSPLSANVKLDRNLHVVAFQIGNRDETPRN